MSQDAIIALARLPRHKNTKLAAFTPSPLIVQNMVENLDLLGLKHPILSGVLVPQNRKDWRFDITIKAKVTQACTITLAPVTTHISENTTRFYRDQIVDETHEDIQLGPDDTEDSLPDSLDLNDILQEMLALAVPQYPRAPDASVQGQYFGPPGIDAMTDDDAKPLAGLAALKDKLSAPDDKDT
jgi:uncharacterized metal-binding protein YceD (DUF177 family)